jgi:cytochrome c553
MTTTEIAAEHGVTRQTVHAHRKKGVFPKPVEGEGSTRPRFRADEVAAFFAANPPSPGKRTDLTPRQQGEPVTTTTARDRLAETLMSPGLVGLDDEETTELLDAYRAAVVTEVVEALRAKAGELSAQAEAEMRQDLEEKAQVWQEAAEVARRLKRRRPEAQDG